MSGRESTPRKQGPTCGSMEPPVTPGHSSSPRAAASTPAPGTPGGKGSTPCPHTPQHPDNLDLEDTPQTPGGSKLECTIDERLYKRVNIHTAKCTQCDFRNGELMRRCPGCTFQICKPCYEGRLTAGKTLAHGNKPTQGTPKVGSGGRTPRNRVDASTPKASKMSEKIKQEDDKATIMAQKEKATPTAKSTAKKRKIQKPRAIADSEPEMSSEDDFDPDDGGSPTPASKRRRTELTFAESAAVTAVKSPPTTRATRRKSLSGPATSYRDPSPSPSDIDVRNSVGVRPSDIPFDELLYEHGVRHYDEPLLGRQEIVRSNPAALIPDIIKRGGGPRRQPGETLGRIHDKVREKMQRKNVQYAQEETFKNIAAQSKMAKNDLDPISVQQFVEREAFAHKNIVTEDEDDFAAFLKTLEGVAAGWARKTYKKLGDDQQRVKLGMEMRLDLIDRKYMDEIADLIDENVQNWNFPDEAGPSSAQPAEAAPDRQLRPT